MALTAEQLKEVEDGLASIDTALKGDEPSVEPENTTITAPMATSVINNAAYHDFHRIELGTPVITQTKSDKKVPPKVKQLFDLMPDIPWAFGDSSLAAEPSEASEVEDLISDMKQDLANMAAGPVPAMVQIFAVEALSDYIDQSVWTAMSPGERDRLGQLASLWSAFTGRTLSGSESAGAGANGGALGGASGGGGGIVGTILDIGKTLFDPGGFIL